LNTNGEIAAKLREMADLLEAQDSDIYRVAAYRRAARTVETLDGPIEDVMRREGLEGLIELPAIGRGIAAAIAEMIATGRWTTLERLTGAIDPVRLFQTLPGIGPALAGRIHDALHVDTLEALELAAVDGRLAAVTGIGERRAAGIRAAIAERLGYRRVRPASRVMPLPDVSDLLEVDRQYRDGAERGVLPKIAPKRFNPTGEAWLPVLHARRGDWIFTALYSNTERAHRLDRTHDWVVVYYHHDQEPEQQATIVTETHGALAGRRVVRGREGDCALYPADGTGRGGRSPDGQGAPGLVEPDDVKHMD